jgi:hypothetical protein
MKQLEYVNMINTQLTYEQVTCLLSQASRQTKLRILSLSRRDVDNHVDQQIVQQARHNIEHLYFY